MGIAIPWFASAWRWCTQMESTHIILLKLKIRRRSITTGSTLTLEMHASSSVELGGTSSTSSDTQSQVTSLTAHTACHVDVSGFSTRLDRDASTLALR